MKKILILAVVLLSASFASQADTVGRVKNKVGGYINLTDNTTPRCTRTGDGYKVVYSTGSDVNDAPLRGCWSIVDSNAHIIWDGGEERMFPLNSFTLTPYGERVYGDGDASKSSRRGASL